MSSPSYAQQSASILQNFSTILPPVYNLIVALSTTMGIFVALLGIYIATWHQSGPRGGRMGPPSRGIAILIIGSLMSIMPYTLASGTKTFLKTSPQVPTASYHQYTAAGGGGSTASHAVSHTRQTIITSVFELLTVLGYWWMYHGYYLLYRSSREDKAQSEDVQKGWTRLIAGIVAANAMFVLTMITNLLGIHNPLL